MDTRLQLVVLASMASLLSAPSVAGSACDGVVLADGDHFAVPAELAGQPVTLLLDPIDGLLLDSDHARRLGLALLDGREAGLGGQARIGGAGAARHVARFAMKLDLEISGARWHVPRAIVTDLHAGTAGSLGPQHAGLLGTGLLRDYDLDFNPGTRCLRLLKPDTAPPGAIALPVTWMRDRPTIQLTMRLPDGEHLPGQFNLDFGMAGSVRLSTRFVDRHDLVRRLRATPSADTEYGLGGALESYSAELPDITAAGYRSGRIRMSLARETTGADAAPPWDGLVGTEWLDRYHWRFSQQRSTLWLLPLVAAQPTTGALQE